MSKSMARFFRKLVISTQTALRILISLCPPYNKGERNLAKTGSLSEQFGLKSNSHFTSVWAIFFTISDTLSLYCIIMVYLRRLIRAGN
jgi:hypothetical protein